MDSKLCPECETVKPLDQFYFHYASGKHERMCKICKRERQKNYNHRRPVKSGVKHEQKLIDLLRAKGIYACSGKRSRSRWVDVMAFGCIGIEAKLAQRKNNSYVFSFTVKQVQQSVRGDIIVLMIEHKKKPIELFVMRSDDPWLFHGDGTRKQWLNYTPDSDHGNTDEDFNEFMESCRGNWKLLMNVLFEKIRAMRDGTFEDVFTDTLPPVTYKKRNGYGKRPVKPNNVVDVEQPKEPQESVHEWLDDIG